MKRFRIADFTSLSVTAATLGLGLAALGLVAPPAAAQSYRDHFGLTPEQACSDDAQRLCGQFIPDRNTTGACLRRNKRLLSPACASFFGARKLRRHR